MDLDEINKKICMLQDNLFEVDVNIRNKSIVYEQANSLQASQFGMTSVPRMKIDTSNYKMNCGLDTLAALFQDLCDKKGYKSDFYSRYCEISNKLKSDEFKLSFNARCVEYVGDLELVTNTTLYTLYRNSRPIRYMLNKKN